MAYFDLSVDRELDFMLMYKLTADELFVCKLVLYAQNGYPEYLKKFFGESSLTLDLRDILKSLQDKGIILKSYKIPAKNAIFNPADIEFGQIFQRNYHMHSWDMGMDIFNMYPTFMESAGGKFSLKNISKHYNSMDDFCFAYAKAIKFSVQEHEKVMELLQWAIDNGEITYSVNEFVISMKWREIEQLRNEKEESPEQPTDFNPFRIV